MSEQNTVGMVISSGLAIQKAENDTLIQIAIARPRNEDKIEETFLKTLEKHPDFADEALYEFSRGGNMIRGLSVVAAREVMRLWGNCASRVSFIDDGAGGLIACGVFVDMETGRRVEKQMPVPRVVKRSGKAYRLGDDEYHNEARIWGSKMERNAMLDCLPEPMKSSFYSRCVEISDAAAEKSNDPVPVRWEKFQKSLAAMKIPVDRALKYLKVKTPQELNHPLLNILRRTLKAIDQGETSISVFGISEDGPPPQTTASGDPPAGAQVAAGATVKEKTPEKAAPTETAKEDTKVPTPKDGGEPLIAKARALIERIVEGPERDKVMQDAFGTTSWDEVALFSVAEMKMATDSERIEKLVARVLGEGSGDLFGKGGK